jgi:hypothetical protein
MNICTTPPCSFKRPGILAPLERFPAQGEPVSAGWVERSEATPVNMRIRNSNFFFRTLSKMDLSYSNEACHVEGIGQTR